MATAFEATVTVSDKDVRTEDSGCAKILEIDGGHERTFIRFQSWSEDQDHPEIDRLMGRRVRVTIETID